MGCWRGLGLALNPSCQELGRVELAERCLSEPFRRAVIAAPSVDYSECLFRTAPLLRDATRDDGRFLLVPWGIRKQHPALQRAQSPKVIVTGCLDAVGLLGDEGAI